MKAWKLVMCCLLAMTLSYGDCGGGFLDSADEYLTEIEMLKDNIREYEAIISDSTTQLKMLKDIENKAERKYRKKLLTKAIQDAKDNIEEAKNSMKDCRILLSNIRLHRSGGQ